MISICRILNYKETKVTLSTLIKGDTIEIFGMKYNVDTREFAINEDAFFTVYYLMQG